MKKDLEKILKEALIFTVIIGSIYLISECAKPCLNYVKQESYKVIQDFKNSFYLRQ